jgi:hypothetical protein
MGSPSPPAGGLAEAARGPGRGDAGPRVARPTPREARPARSPAGNAPVAPRSCGLPACAPAFGGFGGWFTVNLPCGAAGAGAIRQLADCPMPLCEVASLRSTSGKLLSNGAAPRTFFVAGGAHSFRGMRGWWSQFFFARGRRHAPALQGFPSRSTERSRNTAHSPQRECALEVTWCERPSSGIHRCSDGFRPYFFGRDPLEGRPRRAFLLLLCEVAVRLRRSFAAVAGLRSTSTS